MTLQQLVYVIETAKHGSINKAAAASFTSQSNVSALIGDLEEELGILLFERSHKGVSLTPRGKEFFSYIQPIVEQIGKIQDIYSQDLQEPKVHFSVSTQRYPFVARAFVEFLEEKRLERYEFKLKETDMYQVIEDIYENRGDIGIIFLTEVTARFLKKVLLSKKLEFREVAKVVPHVYVGTHHPLATEKEVLVQNLLDYPYIAFGQNDNSSLNYAEEIAVFDLNQAKKAIQVYDRASMYNLLCHSMGFSVGSGIMPQGYGEDRIVTIPIKNHKDVMTLGWIKKRGKEVTEDMKLFLTYLQNSMTEKVSR